MKTRYTVAFALLAGFGLGAVAVQGLHAQAKAPVYSVAEIDIADPAAYSTYVPKAQAAIKAAGGKILAAGGKVTTIEGEPPKSRVVIQQWDSLENSTPIVIQQPSRICSPSARRWPNFATSSLRVCRNKSALVMTVAFAAKGTKVPAL